VGDIVNHTSLFGGLDGSRQVFGPDNAPLKN
jgi:hypothetical protein